MQSVGSTGTALHGTSEMECLTLPHHTAATHQVDKDFRVKSGPNRVTSAILVSGTQGFPSFSSFF